MAEIAAAGPPRPGRVALAVALLVWAIAAIALPLATLQFNLINFSGVPLGFWITAQGAMLLLALLALLSALGASVRAFAFAAEALPAAGTLGLIGVVAATGFDGLALPLGFAAGLALLTIVVAPWFAATGRRSLPAVFFAHSNSTATGALAGTITLVSAALLISAELRGADVAAQVLTELPAGFGAIITAAAVALLIVASHQHSKALAGLLFILIAAALIASAALVSARATGQIVPYLGFGETIKILDAAELSLIERGLTDPQFASPMTTAFLDTGLVSFAGILVGMAFGTAVLPHLLRRHLATTEPRTAKRTTAGALTLLVTLLTLIPMIAAAARLRLNDFIGGNVAVSEVLPAWLMQPGVTICGSAATDAAARTAACAAIPGHQGIVRLHDIAIPVDAYPFIAFDDSGLPLPTLLIFAAAILVAVVLSARAITAGSAPVDAKQRTAPYALLLLAAATAIAFYSQATIATLMASALVLLGSSIFPALVLTWLWPRGSAAAPFMAMLTGASVAATYLAGPHLFPELFFQLTRDVSSAPGWIVEEIASLQQSLPGLATEAERTAATAQIAAYQTQIANWWGVKPLGAAVFAVPAALLCGVLAGFLARLTGRRTSSAIAG